MSTQSNAHRGNQRNNILLGILILTGALLFTLATVTHLRSVKQRIVQPQTTEIPEAQIRLCVELFMKQDRSAQLLEEFKNGDGHQRYAMLMSSRAAVSPGETRPSIGVALRCAQALDEHKP